MARHKKRDRPARRDNPAIPDVTAGLTAPAEGRARRPRKKARRAEKRKRRQLHRPDIPQTPITQPLAQLSGEISAISGVLASFADELDSFSAELRALQEEVPAPPPHLPGEPAAFPAMDSLAGPVTAPATFDAPPPAPPADAPAAPAAFDVASQDVVGLPQGPAVFAASSQGVVGLPQAPAVFAASSRDVVGLPQGPAAFADATVAIPVPPPPRRPMHAAHAAARPRPFPWMVASSVGLGLASAAVLALGVYLRPRPAPVVAPAVMPAPVEPTWAVLHKDLPLPPTFARFDPLPHLPQQVVLHGRPRHPKVALTFDACSTTRFLGWDERVAEILERYEVPATFFLGGRLVAERPEIARRLAENPRFDLQNHTWAHPHLPDIPPARVVDELQRTDRALFAATGRRATLFRPPFGEYSTEVVKAATRAGYLPIQYDIASGDPDPGFHWDKLFESVVGRVRPGSIVVLHANGNGVHTPEALPLIIDGLRGRGFELTTVWDVLADGAWVTDDGRKGPRRRPPPPVGGATPAAAPVASPAEDLEDGRTPPLPEVPTHDVTPTSTLPPGGPP